jgi:hypothetical protein
MPGKQPADCDEVQNRRARINVAGDELQIKGHHPMMSPETIGKAKKPGPTSGTGFFQG